jgi:dihydrofolate reductase
MRKLVVGMFVTLDGVMQAPGGPDEDREGGFSHGGWLVPYLDDQFGANMDAWTQQAGALLLGRKTYEMFASSWPNSSNPEEKLNIVPKFVASRTLERVDWNNSTLLQGDVGQEVAKLKAQDGGEIQVHGSGNLVQTLLRHDLVDVFHIWQFPVVLGTGKRLFAEGALPGSYRLIDTQFNTKGAVLHVYERLGKLKYGEFEVGQEAVVFEPEA